MNQRRNFLKRTAILGLGSVMFQNELLANGLFGPRYPNEGLQLFTLFVIEVFIKLSKSVHEILEQLI